jgi:hypothetical protein
MSIRKIKDMFWKEIKIINKLNKSYTLKRMILNCRKYISKLDLIQINGNYIVKWLFKNVINIEIWNIYNYNYILILFKCILVNLK